MRPELQRLLNEEQDRKDRAQRDQRMLANVIADYDPATKSDLLSALGEDARVYRAFASELIALRERLADLTDDQCADLIRQLRGQGL